MIYYPRLSKKLEALLHRAIDMVEDSAVELYFHGYSERLPEIASLNNGWYILGTADIHINANLQASLKISTIIHELAHYYDYMILSSVGSTDLENRKPYKRSNAERLAYYVERNMIKHLDIDTGEDLTMISNPDSLWETEKAEAILTYMKKFFDNTSNKDKI